jgi:glycosyltransferase involved in cell wall biosynthesis
MLGHKSIPSRVGGVEIVVEELSTRMVALGHEVTVFNRRPSPKINSYKDVHIKRVFTINKKGLAAASSSFFAALKAAFGPYDIVHFHAEGPCAMIWLPKLFGKRTVATIHGLDYQRAKWGGFAKKYLLYGEKSAAKHADEIIVLSKAMQEYFGETYGRDTNFIPNGLNPPTLREANEIMEQFGLTKDSYILYLARIVPEKGLHYLIEAFKQTDTDKKLIIAGDASDTSGYLAQVKALTQNDPRITFTGFVQGHLLDELYSNASIYILPSDVEGMPLSLLEALSYGNCCLVSDIPECTEIVGSHAAKFNHGDVTDLANQLANLLTSPQAVANYKQTASDYTQGRYNWNEVVNQTLELYKSQKSFPAEASANSSD